MYFIEVIIKNILNKRNNPKVTKEKEDKDYYCEHVYLPVDSTGKYLACTKCGDVIKNEKNIKKNNPFD